MLDVQRKVRALGPPEMAELKVISLDELHEIRRLWLNEKHEFDDALPRIYQEIAGEAFPARPSDDKLLGPEDWQLLKEVCGDDEHFFEIQADMLDVEQKFRSMTRRAGVFDALADCLKAGQFESEEEAIRIRTEQEARLKAAEGEEVNKSPQKTLFEEG